MTTVARGLIALALTVTVADAALPQTAESVLAAAEQRYAGVQTLHAPFVQTIINEMLGDPLETRGML